MRIKKIDDTFNDYKVEISYGQLVAIRNALEKDHSDPLSDEIYAEVNFYLNNVPGPGESTEEFKAEKDATEKTKDEAGQELAPEDADGPPTEAGLEAGDGAGGPLPAPPEDENGGAPAEMELPGEDEGGPGAGFQEGPKLSPEEREIIDRGVQGGPSQRPTGINHGLPRPPAE